MERMTRRAQTLRVLRYGSSRPNARIPPYNTTPPDVPEMQDEKVQQFFQQIVEHLNVMQQPA
jgi:hypothetical protein